MTHTSSVMVSSEEATRGRAVLQALRERGIRQERHGERPPALPLQRLPPQLHGDAAPRQAAGDEGLGGPALLPGQRQPGHDRQAARGEPRRRLQVGQGGRRGCPGAFGHSLGRHRADRRDVALRGREKTRTAKLASRGSPERSAVRRSVMARTAPRARPDREQVLETVHAHCPACGGRRPYRYDNRHTVSTLAGLVRLRLKVRRCEDAGCVRHHRPYRPEAEGAIALPQHEFGLDVIALVGALRYREHRSVPEIHRALRERGVAVCERTVTNLLDRYDELVATVVDEPRRAALAAQGRVVLAIDGLQPDVGHEVLWAVRDCLSGQVLLARSLLSAAAADLAGLLREVVAAVGVPVAGVVSDGQHSVRRAVQEALPEVPHQLCQFHYLREAALPIFEADRHAKKELKKRVRGVRPIERAVEGRDDPEAEAVRGYCAAVRSALTDDGRPPLAASGLKLKDRLSAAGRGGPPGAGRPPGAAGGLNLRDRPGAVVPSLDRVAEKGG